MDTPSLLLRRSVWCALFVTNLIGGFCSGNDVVETNKAYSGCVATFHHKCQCRTQLYEEGEYFLTNCTASGFKNASILASISPDTQVVIFRGNRFPTLPARLFGPKTIFVDLVEIDLSSNRIRHVRNDTFDLQVQMVKKFAMGDNEWHVDGDADAFGAFEALEELHLAGAFDKEQATAEILGSLRHQFELATEGRGALQSLRVVHLENNLFEHFNDDSLLCLLPAVEELYLGNNRIAHFSVTRRCARPLRVLDLSGNMIKRLGHDAMADLGALPQLKVDLNDNPFFCDCLLKNTTRWMEGKKDVLLVDPRYRCDDGYPARLKGRNVMDLQDKDLLCAPVPFLEDEYPRAGLIILGVVLMIAAGIIAGLLYLNRAKVRQCLRSSTQPILRKFEYSSIGRREEGEVDV